MADRVPLLNNILACMGASKNRLLKYLLAMGLGLAILTVGISLSWHYRSERVYHAGLESISRGDVEVLQRAADALPVDSPRSLLLLAAIDLQKDRPASALRKLNRAVRYPETSLWAQFLAGEALCRLKEYDAAIRTLRTAVEQDPENVDGRRWLAVAAYDTGASAVAVEQLTKITQLDERDARAHRAIGLIYFEAEEYSKAIDALCASLKRSSDQPDIIQVLTELATSQLKVHRYQDALETLARAPQAPELDGIRAEALYALGRREEARELVERLLKTDPTPRTLMLNGIMLQDEGKAVDAIVPLKRAVTMQPEDLESRARLTQAYAQAGDQAAARAELAEMERIKGIRQEIHEYTIQAANQPASPDVRYELGIRYQSLGLLLMAQKWFRAALAFDPTHAAARKALNDLPDVIPASSQN